MASITALSRQADVLNVHHFTEMMNES